MLVTDLGIIFIELIQRSDVSKLTSRITYWGRVKSALPDPLLENIMFFNIGQNAAISVLRYLYSVSYPHLRLATHTSAQIFGAHVNGLGSPSTYNLSVVDVISPLYIADRLKGFFIAQIPPMLGVGLARESDLYGAKDEVLEGRDVIRVTAGYASSNTGSEGVFLIYLDYWEY